METVAAEVEQPRALSRDELVEMLGTLAEVGSLELKVTVPGHQRMALRSLGLDLLRGSIREVFFFDTPDLTLFHAGVVVRARRTQGAPDDTVVKLRPVVPHDLSPEVRASPNLKVEMDATRGSYVVSASLKGRRPPGAVRQAVLRERPLQKLFTKEQRAFFAEHAPDGVSWSDLASLGPAFVVLLKFVHADLGRKAVIEQWHYPGEVPLVELSTKGPSRDALQLYTDPVAFLRAHGLSATCLVGVDCVSGEDAGDRTVGTMTGHEPRCVSWGW